MTTDNTDTADQAADPRTKSIVAQGRQADTPEGKIVLCRELLNTIKDARAQALRVARELEDELPDAPCLADFLRAYVHHPEAMLYVKPTNPEAFGIEPEVEDAREDGYGFAVLADNEGRVVDGISIDDATAEVLRPLAAETH